MMSLNFPSVIKEQRIKADILAEDGHVDTWMFFAVLTTF